MKECRLPPPFQDLVDASQDFENEYRARPVLAMWRGSRFEWLLDLPPATKGSIGRRFLSAIAVAAGITVSAERGGSPPTLGIRGRSVAVKFSTLWTDGSGYKFQQIRQDPYEQLACLGISPTQAHLWVIPRDVVWSHTDPQHAGRAGHDTHWLPVDPAAPAAWLGPYGGDLSAGLMRLSRL